MSGAVMSMSGALSIGKNIAMNRQVILLNQKHSTNAIFDQQL